MTPRVIIVAGPNGANKTTFANEYLSHEAGCPNVVHANLLAAGLSPFHPKAAAVAVDRWMLSERPRDVGDRQSSNEDKTFEPRSAYEHKKRYRAEVAGPEAHRKVNLGAGPQQGIAGLFRGREQKRGHRLRATPADKPTRTRRLAVKWG